MNNQHNGNNELFKHYDDVDNLLKSLKLEGKEIQLEFLNLQRKTFEEYLSWLKTKKSHVDPLGFPIAENVPTKDKIGRTIPKVADHHIAIEKIWFQYMKSIGGPENLKPVGVFTPSDDLCELVRRGVPIAYRALIWNKISLSDLKRRQYPTSYYKSLLDRAETELPDRTGKEISNDTDR